MPMTFESHRWCILFRDERVGEMQYTLNGNPKLPQSIDLHPASFILEGEMNHVVGLTSSNIKKDKARKIHYDRIPHHEKKRMNEMEKLSKSKQQEYITYELESRTPLMALPSQVTIQ
mmetsp:Transcript_41489/g.36865  ORF Transcript_41489/g.36865 Transcript_41489/m.36865 type:complete len:117 (-) Transcript_41489:582-932(-)